VNQVFRKLQLINAIQKIGFQFFGRKLADRPVSNGFEQLDKFSCVGFDGVGTVASEFQLLNIPVKFV